MENDKIKCCHTRKCKWEGLQRDLVEVPSKQFPGISAFDRVCPRCGSKEFYIVERAPESQP